MALNLGGGSLTSNYSSLYLGNAQSMLSKSLMRLSSGQRINRPSDDPGGLAVSMKLQNAITVTESTKRNVDNALSYTDTQDSALESVADILDRDVDSTCKLWKWCRNIIGQGCLCKRVQELQKQLDAFKSETFNSLSLFSSSSVSKQVVISTQGLGPTISISSLNLSGALSVSSTVNLANATGAVTISGLASGT